jgi:hypothetical protein
VLAAEGVARSSDNATSGELCFTLALGAWPSRSSVCAQPEPTSLSAPGYGEGSGAAASAVKSRLRPDRDVTLSAFSSLRH